MCRICLRTNGGTSGSLCDGSLHRKHCHSRPELCLCAWRNRVAQPTISSARPPQNGNNITACHVGDTITGGQSLSFGLASNMSKRYNVGLFIGEQDQDLTVAGGTCSVTTFPTSPAPWADLSGGDTCGDYTPAGSSNDEIDNVTLKCEPDPATGFSGDSLRRGLFRQNGSPACTGPTDVAPGTSSKCSHGGVVVTGVPVTFNANPTCTFAGAGDGVVYNAAAGTITKTFTLTNNGPDPANGTSFADTVPAPVSVTGATCGNALGGAVCPVSVSAAGNNVSATIVTLPSGGSVDITINGTVPAGNTGSYSNTVTLTAGLNVITPAEWVNTCIGSTTLPVKLQSFDVN